LKNNSPAPLDSFSDAPMVPEDAAALEAKLWKLMGEQTERYTMGDSSSVRVELAEGLLRSVCYTLRVCMEEGDCTLSDILGKEDLLPFLRRGWCLIEKKVEIGKKMLLLAVQTSPKSGSISYRDTINGLGNFFKRYDLRFFAHEIPADIDYPLCRPVPDGLSGICYINEYLRCLIIENRFMGCFDTDTAKSLLKRFCPDYRKLLINLYEPLAANAIGSALIDSDVRGLYITMEDVRMLNKLLSGKTNEQMEALLENAAKRVCALLDIQDNFSQNYLCQTAVDLRPRIGAALASGNLDGVFITHS
jgi:hypothetical protein